MILSLILATLDQLSAPDEGIHEERNPLTPIAFQKFRTEAALSEREKLSGGGPRKKRKTTTGDGGFPTLVDILLHKCRVAPEGIPLRDPRQQERMEGHSLLRPLMANVPFYLQTHDLEETSGRRARQQGTKGPKVMYLTSATLVIVPDNLRRQWANEILKHCTDLLRVLLVDDKHELPDATTLASDYDVSCPMFMIVA